jgi:hypothetical protein
MLPVPVFASWRPLWNQDEITKRLADNADSLAQRRNLMHAGSGEVEDLRRLAPRLRHFLLLRREQAEELKQRDPALLYRSYLSGIGEFRPIIEAARWARWLLLEQALADAMQYGDLLFGALVLRTQIEDLGTLLRLEQIERQLRAEPPAPFSASDVTIPDLAAIEEIVDFLWERFLPRFETLTPEEMGARKRNGRIIQWPDELAKSFSALNDYVHPNYGSHIAAIFPESSASPIILLTAFNAAYDVFLHLDFVQQRPARQPRSASQPSITYVRVLRRFVEKTLPSLDRLLRSKRSYPEQWAPQPLSIFKNRLERETDRHRITADGLLDVDDDTESWQKLQEKTSTLRSLCFAVEPDREWSTEDILHFAETHTAPIVALNTAMWVLLASLRDLARTLESGAEQLPTDVLFPRQPPFDPWMYFARDAIQLAILATQHKMDLMRFAALRMVNQSNALGALLCVRSLLEHYAVARELAERFKKGVESIEEAARSGRDVVPQFERLEQDIGRFLIGTKATSEFETRWKERWNQLGIQGHVNVAQAVERTFPQGDWRGLLYAYFPRCAHGEQLTGADVMRTGSELIISVNLAKVVMVLADSEAIEWTLDYFSPVAAAMLRLTRPAGSADAASFDELRRALRKGTTFGQPLKPGRDVHGQGTEGNPYRFREDLEYYETFYQFCRERGIDLDRWKRQVWLADGKRGDCLTSPDGDKLYFQVTREPWTSR